MFEDEMCLIHLEDLCKSLEWVFPVSFFSRCICSMIALSFSWIFPGIEAVWRASSRACPNINVGLTKNVGWKLKDISEAGRFCCNCSMYGWYLLYEYVSWFRGFWDNWNVSGKHHKMASKKVWKPCFFPIVIFVLKFFICWKNYNAPKLFKWNRCVSNFLERFKNQDIKFLEIDEGMIQNRLCFTL